MGRPDGGAPDQAPFPVSGNAVVPASGGVSVPILGRVPVRDRVPVPFFGRGPVRGGALALLVATLVAAAGCSADDAGQAGDTGAAGDDPASDPAGVPAGVPAPSEPLALPDGPAEACTAVLEGGLAIEGRTRAALRAELGEADSVAREAVPNRHVPGATDTVVTMRWPAATAVVRVAQERELVDAIRVTDARHLRYAGVGPGTPRDSILARLGEPGRRVGGAESDPETLSYWCPSEPGAESPVVFHLRDGRVAMVEWDFYVD